MIKVFQSNKDVFRELWPAKSSKEYNRLEPGAKNIYSESLHPSFMYIRILRILLKRTADETESPCNQARDKAQFSSIFAERMRIPSSPEAGSVSLLNLARVLQLPPSTSALVVLHS